MRLFGWYSGTMQTRPYDEKDGLRIWLAQSECQDLLDVVGDDPRRELALQLGMHGLRTNEIVDVEARHVRALAGDAEGHVLTIPDGKTGKREVPISEDIAQSVRWMKSGAQLRQDEPLIDVSTRTLRNWIRDAREKLAEQAENAAPADAYGELGMHDLRRTWATSTYYALAFAGVPIAEQLVMSWGGWKQTKTGRETFRENYLGPVPDHITGQATKNLAMA